MEKGVAFISVCLQECVKVIECYFCLLLPFGMGSCLYDPIPPMLQDTDSIVVITDSAYEDLLDAASDYANAAYFANVDEQYEIALQYADSAILLLNEHYQKYARRMLRIGI